MFGYVKPCKGELKIKHWHLYRAFYCGVCRSRGERYGQNARLLLNYDMAFFAMMLAARDANYSLRPGRCMIKAKKQLFAYGQALDIAADMNMLLAYYKFLDDYQDEKSLIGLLGKNLYGGKARRLGEQYVEVRKSLDRMLEDERLVEAVKCQSPDIAATPFAEMMKGLSDRFTEHDEKSRSFFHSLGKWIYIIDALDDVEKDAKNGSYNPFQQQLRELGIEKLRENSDVVMCLYMKEVAEAFDQLDLKDDNLKTIIENIVLAGLLEKTELVLKKRGCEDFGEKSI